MVGVIFVNAPSCTIGALRGLVGSSRAMTTMFTRPSGPINEGRVLAPPPIGMATGGCGVPICRPRSMGANRTLSVVGRVTPSIVIIITCNGVLPGRVLSTTGCNYMGNRTSLLPGCHNTSPVR